MDSELIHKIVERNGGGGNGLISVLEEVQAKFGYLPADALQAVAEMTKRPLIDVYGVATFYRAFSLKPRGEHLVSVCLGTACHVRGAPRVAQEFERQLGVTAGETTPDRKFTYATVNCLGACALGPVVVVDGHYFSNVNASKVREIIKKATEGLDRIETTTDRRIFPVEVSCSRCSHSLMDPHHPIDGFPSVRITQSFGQQHGWLRLSSLYGSYNIESEYEIPLDTVLHLFCPHCHTELIGGADCPECGAQMVPLILRGGGTVQICPRRGCKGHILDIG